MNAIRPHPPLRFRPCGPSRRFSPLRGLAAVAAGLLLTGLTPSALAAKRIALVIGNNNYTEEPLANAVADCQLMSGVLQRCGFEVIAVENAGIAAFNAFDLSSTGDVTPPILGNDWENGGFVIFVRSGIAHLNLGNDIRLWKLRGVGAR